MLSKSVVAAALLAGSAVAQSTTLNLTYVDPASVDPQTAASWCIGQRSSCSTLCDGNAPTNDCDAQQLSYSCLCTNGSSPDLADYKNTLPDFVCQANFAGCIKAHPNDAVGQDNCKSDIQAHCGFLNITDYKPSSGSGSGSSSSQPASPSQTSGGSGGGSSSGSGGSSQTSGSSPSSTKTSNPAATSSSAAMALTNGKNFGAGVLAAGLLAAFGFML